MASSSRQMCALCKKDLNQPKQLKICFHIFCKDCLQPSVDNAEDGNVICPFELCGKSSPKEDISESSAAVRERHSESLEASSVEETDPAKVDKCPICRNTDRCKHEEWLRDLLDDNFCQNERCSIPEHLEGNMLIAFCQHPDCNEPICGNCSKVEHKDHVTVNIGRAAEQKLHDLRLVKEMLTGLVNRFKEEATACKKAENEFIGHVRQVEKEIDDRKAAMLNHVEDAFKAAFRLIEQTWRKQAELNQQSRGMHQEWLFLNKATKLADSALKEGAPSLEIVRVWKGLKLIFEDLGFGEGDKKKKSQEPEVVMPQRIVEKMLVLPAPSCMNPDLRVLQKVGVENTVLRQAFSMKAEMELLYFYSILPLTQTEALLSCKPRAGVTTIVQYSYWELPHHRSVPVAKGADVCIMAVSGNGIVATLYDAPSGSGGAKNQVLFWRNALGVSMKELEAQVASENMRVIADTKYPPRGLAVTSDNHVVVCTAEDPLRGDQTSQKSCILVMTLQGDIIHQRSFKSSWNDQASSLCFPRYVTVNINDDICVTDEKDHSVIIFNRQLENKLRIINPYDDRDELNKNFSPRGICHDSFGRLIVADSNNNAVLRMEYDDVKVRSVKTILKNREDEVTDLDSPRLVAMGKGATEQSSRLWVVCRDNIQVFDYTDKE